MTEYADDYAEAIAAELKGERANKGLTIEELGAAAGISKLTAMRYLNSHRQIPVPVFLDFCDALGVTPRFIFDRAKQRLDEENRLNGE